VYLSDPAQSDENKEQLCAWQEFLKNDSYVERKLRKEIRKKAFERAKALAAGNSLNSVLAQEKDSSFDQPDLVLSALDVGKAIIYYSTNLKYHRWYSMQVYGELYFANKIYLFYITRIVFS
jgi:hypothetical protein